MRTLQIILFLAGLAFTLAVHAEPRTYPATVQRVIDGDTVRLEVDLGFSVTLHGVDVRMADVYAPERFTPQGPAATEALRSLLPVGAAVTFTPRLTPGGDMQRSFTRYVGTIVASGNDINAAMRAKLLNLTPSLVR